MEPNLKDVLAFAQRLEAANIHYSVRVARPDALMFTVVVPGERWEVECMEDGSMEVEVFRSAGDILDESSLDDLFDRHSD